MDEPSEAVWSDGDLAGVVIGRPWLDGLRQTLRLEAGELSPGELVGRGVQRLGVDQTASLLRGPFAFVVLEGHLIHFARDHVGLRPLYYCRQGQELYAGSEIKQVVAGAGTRGGPNLGYVEGMIFGFDSHVGETPVDQVLRFPRASTASLKRGQQIEWNRYWDPGDLLETADLGVQEARERFVELAEQAVRRCLTGDDLVALSGGIDSTTVAALAAEPHVLIRGRPLKALSAVFPHQPSVDERTYIEEVASDLDLDLSTYVQQARPLDNLETWVRRLDGPGTTLSMPQINEMYETARRLGAHTILTGELAEYAYSMERGTLAHLLVTGKYATAVHHVRDHRSQGRSWSSLGREVLRSLAPSPALAQWSMRRALEQLPPWVSPSRMSAFRQSPDIPPPRERWRYFQMVPIRGLFGITLDDVDVCAAHAGITVRYPLVDVDLWEFMLSLPAHVKFPYPLRKSFVRQAMRGRVPDSVLDRRDKTVFDAHGLASADYDTIREWIFSGNLRLEGIDYELLDERLRSRRIPVTELDWANNLARAYAFLSQW